MSVLLTAKGIAERSLRLVQAYAINDTSADPEELRETLYWMDMLVAHKAATNRLYFLTPADVIVPLPATKTFDLVAAAGALWPTSNVLSFYHAMLTDSSGTETNLRVLRRDEYEEILNKNATGRPEAIYIDRLDPSYTASLWPVPTDTSYSAKFVVQTYASNIAIDNKAAPTPPPQHGMTAGWQLWLVFGTAALISRGAVRALPPAEIKDLEVAGDKYFSDLYINANNERASEPRITRSSDSRVNRVYRRNTWSRR